MRRIALSFALLAACAPAHPAPHDPSGAGPGGAACPASAAPDVPRLPDAPGVPRLPDAPGEPSEPGPKPAPRPAMDLGAYRPATDAEVAEVVRASQHFATDLYAKLRGRSGNFALSPASIAIALGMTYAGGRNETAAEMQAVLHLGDDSEAVHRAFGTLVRTWNAGKDRPYELAVANRLFGEKTLHFRDPFVVATRDHYLASFDAVDFIGDPDGSRVHVNDWVAAHTQDRILDLVPEGSVDGTTRLVLANAVYFKGDWQVAFPAAATQPEPFHAKDATPQTPMMHLTSDFSYAHVDGVQLLEMPYKGGDLAMTVLLPDDRDGLGELEKKLGADALARWLGARASREVIVSLPRFKVDPPVSISLGSTLAELGMPLAFDRERADFRQMADLPPDTNLYLQDAIHRAFVAVDEKGTEAAAATAVVVGAAITSVAPEPPPPVVFRADHPFLFLVRDTHSGALLFMGRVADPTQP